MAEYFQCNADHLLKAAEYDPLSKVFVYDN